GAVAAAAFVVDGGIYRHDFVAQAVVDGLMRAGMDTGVPVLSVSLTPHHYQDTEHHKRIFREHFVLKGREAAQAALMIGRPRAMLAAAGSRLEFAGAWRSSRWKTHARRPKGPATPCQADQFPAKSARIPNKSARQPRRSAPECPCPKRPFLFPGISSTVTHARWHGAWPARTGNGRRSCASHAEGWCRQRSFPGNWVSA